MVILENSMTTRESIFIVKDTHIENFKRIAANAKVYEDLIKEYPVNMPNKCPMTFNFFCVFFLEDSEKIVMDYNKMMLYSSTFYCIQLLRNQQEIQQFLQAHAGEAEMCYLLAYYTAYELMSMVKEAVQREEKNLQVYEKYQNGLYFLLHEQEDNYQHLDSVAYSEQKIFVSIFSESYKRKLFHRCVERAINKAYIHRARLKMHILGKNDICVTMYK